MMGQTKAGATGTNYIRTQPPAWRQGLTGRLTWAISALWLAACAHNAPPPDAHATLIRGASVPLSVPDEGVPPAAGPDTASGPATATAPADVPAAARYTPPLPAEYSPTTAAVKRPTSLREDVELRYVVQPGDTLWGIASRYLGEPWEWPEIWYGNEQVSNPHRIYPGDVLTFIWRDGKPRLQREPELPVARLSPQIRELPLVQPIPTIPLEIIRDFLRGPRVVDADALKRAPYVVSFAEPHLIEGAGHEAYIKGIPPAAPDAWQAVRIGKKYKDPDNGEVLGWEAIPVADMQVVQAGEPATVLMTRSYREARAGDHLIAPPPALDEQDFYPHAPEHAIGARILSVYDGVSQIGQYQVVSLSRGSNAGLEPGHVLHILQSGRKADDPYGRGQIALPERQAGTLLVFSVEPRIAHALVMSSTREIHLLDRAESPLLRPLLSPR